MRLRPLAAAVFLVLLSILAATLEPSRSDAPMGPKEVEESLTCQCGCGLTVGSCNHLECSFAVPARKDIAESFARGETGEQILTRYKDKYGEKVLSSPVAEGFNMLAWIAPYLAILVAGTAMFAFFRRRAAVVAPEGPPAAGPAPGGGDADPRLEQLRNEVEDLKR